ncbi:Protein of unknown function [Lactobacillus hominis DSM 23910 = CRBIP 24.179]|uniref:Uncharacterized protein n=1 Tax=Lactobacillus hominis DSM 23910 = CRBIP 24.179 TaxID=1423758 RepID=I7L7K2_9LACO|nr:Protein of unknown function [Lactobacillus hominis DSM 23910 = CRBIP 24.179]
MRHTQYSFYGYTHEYSCKTKERVGAILLLPFLMKKKKSGHEIKKE